MQDNKSMRDAIYKRKSDTEPNALWIGGFPYPTCFFPGSTSFRKQKAFRGPASSVVSVCRKMLLSPYRCIFQLCYSKGGERPWRHGHRLIWRQNTAITLRSWGSEMLECSPQFSQLQNGEGDTETGLARSVARKPFLLTLIPFPPCLGGI